jgi:hypothetical protein
MVEQLVSQKQKKNPHDSQASCFIVTLLRIESTPLSKPGLHSKTEDATDLQQERMKSLQFTEREFRARARQTPKLP